jgi:uncharacterized protein
MIGTAAIYEGQVVHKRLRPRLHSLAYKVYALLVDVDRIENTSSMVRLFSYNKPNLCSLYDRDFGAGDGTPVAVQARRLFETGGFDTAGGRILLLAYPRNLGYAFNPLSVYFLVGRDGSLKALTHEVTNTFGERKSYVVAASEPGTGGIYAQSCRKELFVSPFAEKSGRYHFRVREPGEAVTVGVAYDDGQGPLIKTHFFGAYRPFTDRNLASLLIRLPLMTFKVTGAIHFEALKLWLKGVPLVRGHASPRYSVSYVRASDRHLRAPRDLIDGN